MIVVVGLSHRTAPIEVRERFALPEDRIPSFLGELQRQQVQEAFVVSTCNRVEVVAAGSSNTTGELERVALTCRGVLASLHPSVDEHLYMHLGSRAVHHLFRVASSLDSLVVGEPQILGQMKQGYERARQAGTLGSTLHRSFQRAVRAAKRVRNETAIGVGQVSVPTVALDLAKQIFGELSGRRVMLVGSGDMGCSIARLFRDSGARLTVFARRLEAAEKLAQEVRGTARVMDQLAEGLAEADILVSSTSALQYVITKQQLAAVARARRGNSLFAIDLAVPRDIEPSVGDLDSVFLYNIDDLAHVVENSQNGRLREAEVAERIVVEEARNFERRIDADQATPVIKALRARLRGALEVELERSVRGRLRGLGPEERAAMGKMLEAALNRMLHVPTQRLREEGIANEHWLETLEELFELSSVDPEALEAPSVRVPAGDTPSLAPGAPRSIAPEASRSIAPEASTSVAPEAASDSSDRPIFVPAMRSAGER